jgi:hypothetical protein
MWSDRYSESHMALADHVLGAMFKIAIPVDLRRNWWFGERMKSDEDHASCLTVPLWCMP